MSRSSAKFLFGASIKTDYSQWKDDPKTHRGIPSELIEISDVVINKGSDADGEYSEIVVPDTFEPGSIMLFETDMTVSAPSLPPTYPLSLPPFPTPSSALSLFSPLSSCLPIFTLDAPDAPSHAPSQLGSLLFSFPFSRPTHLLPSRGVLVE